jgi:hypothetical protein
MNNVTKIAIQLSIVLASASLAAAPLPKEGPANFGSCWVGDLTLMEASKESQFGSLHASGLIFTPTEGALLDGSTFECLFQVSIDATARNANGVCVIVDADGDKTSQNYTAVNGAGKWSFVGGTGKYAGITGGGEYKPSRKFPAMMQQGKRGGCNNVTGTYKLP